MFLSIQYITHFFQTHLDRTIRVNCENFVRAKCLVKKGNSAESEVYPSDVRVTDRLTASQFFLTTGTPSQSLRHSKIQIMASSARSRPSGTSNRQRAGLSLPTYQPPQHPLNENAIRAIQDIHRNHRLDSLKTRLNTAHNHLAGAAVDVNDRLVARSALHEKSRARREKQGSQEDNEEEERAMDEKRRQTDELTERLESGVRKIIDAKVVVHGVEKALKELETNVANNRGAIVPTQSTLGASQFRSTRQRRGGGGNDDDSEFDEDAQSAGENEGALDFIKRKTTEENSKYMNETMSFR